MLAVTIETGKKVLRVRVQVRRSAPFFVGYEETPNQRAEKPKL